MSFKNVLDKTEVPSATAYEDESNTFSATQTFSAPIQLGTLSSPSANGQIGYNGTEILFREGGANKKIASTDTASTYSALQTYTGGIQVNTFTPTVNGQIGYNGTNILFREGGVNKVLSSGGTTNIYTQQSGSTTSVPQSVSTGLASFTLNVADLPVGRSLKIIYSGRNEIGSSSNSGPMTVSIKVDGDTRGTVRTSLEATNATNFVQWEYSILMTRAPDVTDQKVAILAKLESVEHTGGGGGTYVDSQVHINAQGAGPSGFEDIVLDSSTTIQLFVLFVSGSGNVTVNQYQTVAYIV